MIYLLDHLCYPKKKLRVISLLLLGYILWVSGITYRLYMNPHEIHELQHYYQTITHQMIFSITPFFLGWLWMDLEHPHDKVFISCKYPHYLWDIKWIYFLLMSGLYILFFYLVWTIIPLMWIPKFTFQFELSEPIHLWLDMMILYLFSHIFISDKTKTMTLIFPLLYLIFHLLMQDESSLHLYYFLPLYQKEIITFRLAMIYKLWYIGLGFILIRYFYGKTARNG